MEEFDELQTHTHNGRNGKKIKFTDLDIKKETAMSAASGSIATGSGAGSYISASSESCLNNMITRIAEIETILRNKKIIP